MAISASFLNLTKETFASFGTIEIRRMFGGAGVYCDTLFFAILDEDVVYFKVDDVTRGAFERAGLAPFQFEMKDGSMASMSYYNAPESIFDDADDLREWTTLALDAARRARKLKPKRKATKNGLAKPAPAKKKAAKAAKKTPARRKPTSLRAAKKR
ncbi:MAG: TfoX/Sxy family protein [Parvularculaceae bacterium]